MIWKVYLVIVGYFVLGTLGMYFVNRRKEGEARRKAWTKHIVYFFIATGIYFSMAVEPIIFRVLAILIVIEGFIEIFGLYRRSGYKFLRFFMLSEILFAVFACGFILFSQMERETMIFVFVILSIFDGFSQVVGQLLGKKKLFPRVSPNKTVEGLIGGTLIAILSAFIFKDLVGETTGHAILLAAVVSLFAFTGDSLKSIFKRKFQVKDFNNFIPGHGGFLDRFDSLIASGAGMALLTALLIG